MSFKIQEMVAKNKKRTKRIFIALLTVAGVVLFWAGAGKQGSESDGSKQKEQNVTSIIVQKHIDQHRAKPAALDIVGEDCEEELGQLSELIQDYTSVCEGLFAAVGCHPPSYFPFPRQAPGSLWRKEVMTLVSDCNHRSGQILALLDCSEFPCVLVSRHRALRECSGLSGAFDEPLPLLNAAIKQEIGDGWEIHTSSEVSSDGHRIKDNGPLENMYKSRVSARAVRIAENIISLNGRNSVGLFIHNCDRVEQTVKDLMDGEAPCQDVVDFWGCQNDPFDLTEDEALVFIQKSEEISDRIINNCESINVDDTFLDCSMLPCVLSFRQDAPQDGNVFCKPGGIYEFHKIKNYSGSETVSFAVIWPGIDSEHLPDIQERWESEKVFRLMLAASYFYEE